MTILMRGRVDLVIIMPDIDYNQEISPPTPIITQTRTTTIITATNIVTSRMYQVVVIVKRLLIYGYF